MLAVRGARVMFGGLAVLLAGILFRDSVRFTCGRGLASRRRVAVGENSAAATCRRVAQVGQDVRASRRRVVVVARAITATRRRVAVLVVVAAGEDLLQQLGCARDELQGVGELVD